MNTIALGISILGLGVVMGTWIAYFATVPRGKVPVWPLGSIITQCVGIGLAISAIVWSFQGSTSTRVAVIIPGAVAIMMGMFFFWLLSIRKTPIGDLKVKVGDKLMPFKAMTSEGMEFQTDELMGKRILFKFFRGGW